MWNSFFMNFFAVSYDFSQFSAIFCDFERFFHVKWVKIPLKFAAPFCHACLEWNSSSSENYNPHRVNTGIPKETFVCWKDSINHSKFTEAFLSLVCRLLGKNQIFVTIPCFTRWEVIFWRKWHIAKSSRTNEAPEIVLWTIKCRKFQFIRGHNIYIFLCLFADENNSWVLWFTRFS